MGDGGGGGGGGGIVVGEEIVAGVPIVLFKLGLYIQTGQDTADFFRLDRLRWGFLSVKKLYE